MCLMLLWWGLSNMLKRFQVKANEIFTPVLFYTCILFRSSQRGHNRIIPNMSSWRWVLLFLVGFILFTVGCKICSRVILYSYEFIHIWLDMTLRQPTNHFYVHMMSPITQPMSNLLLRQPIGFRYSNEKMMCFFSLIMTQKFPSR